MTSFAVSQFTTWNQTFEQDVQLYASLGIGAIEVCERKLSTDPGRALAQLQRVREYGLTVTSVQPRCHALFVDGMCPDVHDPDQRAARFRGTIDLIARAFPGEPIPLVAIAGRAPDHDHRRAHGIARRIYPQLADYAADHGVRIMFEPLNPILMNVDTFICTFDEAARLIDDVARDNFGMMLDLWHVWRERDIAARIAQYDGSRMSATGPPASRAISATGRYPAKASSTCPSYSGRSSAAGTTARIASKFSAANICPIRCGGSTRPTSSAADGRDLITHGNSGDEPQRQSHHHHRLDHRHRRSNRAIVRRARRARDASRPARGSRPTTCRRTRQRRSVPRR
jgi:sugar phosphate isomerase/epimerase